MKRVFLLLSTIALCACPASPKIINVKNGNEEQLNCTELRQEISAAEQVKIDAHREDKFRFSDMFPPTGFTSVVKIWMAGDRAIARIALLNKIAAEKNCGAQGGAENLIILAQYFPGQEQHAQIAPPPITVAPEPVPAAKPAEAPKPEEEEDPRVKDQSTDEYIKNGYDSEVFPQKDPKHFIF